MDFKRTHQHRQINLNSIYGVAWRGTRTRSRMCVCNVLPFIHKHEHIPGYVVGWLPNTLMFTLFSRIFFVILFSVAQKKKKKKCQRRAKLIVCFRLPLELLTHPSPPPTHAPFMGCDDAVE